MSGSDTCLLGYSLVVMAVLVARWVLLMVTSGESPSEEAVAAAGKEGESFAVSPCSSALLPRDREALITSHGSILLNVS